MKLLLVAINAKYIHSNLAVYSLKAYTEKYSQAFQKNEVTVDRKEPDNSIGILEYTINHAEDDILKGIFLEKAEAVAFSCYLWNIDTLLRLARELKKVQPEVKIWLGGPEVSYHSEQCLRDNEAIDGIMVGEGEQTFLELAEHYAGQGKPISELTENYAGQGKSLSELAEHYTGQGKSLSVLVEHYAVQGKPLSELAENSTGQGKQISEFSEHYAGQGKSLSEINGLVFRLPDSVEIKTTPARQPLNMDSLPFPYERLADFKNKIIYYESSRGCPYSCSYCLSSIDRRVRLRSTVIVKRELQILLDHNVPQIKFVDRTFNCNREHAMELWRFIKEADNWITNFHFEISADLLSEDEIDFLATLRPGQVQFEIGVQTANLDTVEAIHRKMDLDKLSNNVNKLKVGANIHLHLDLIAGLPLEDYVSFERSFQVVYQMKPDQLQLGFLKV